MISFSDYYGNEIYINICDISYIEKCNEDYSYVHVSNGSTIKIMTEVFDLLKQRIKEYYEN